MNDLVGNTRTGDRSMTLLRVHNRYRNRGGEDVSFELEASLLEDHGHTVHRLEFSNADIDTSPLLEQMQVALSTVWSQGSRIRLKEAINSVHPDVVHFDNTFPLVSPAAYSICQDLDVPVVQSLRNYRLVCSSANLFRNGHVCEECLGKTVPYPGVAHCCYRGSRKQTAVVAAMISTHRLLRTWSRHVDRFVAVSAFVRNMIVKGGFPPDIVSVKPNFVDVPAPFDRTKNTDCLYVGRLSEEKGLNTLVEAWGRGGIGRLAIVGAGPMETSIRDRIKDNETVILLGRRSEKDAYRLMAESRVVVVPSEWHEPFGRVVVEAFAQGTPVIASQRGGLSELVRHGVTGLLFTAGDADDLACKAKWAAEHPGEMRVMGENARREYEAKYTPERNYHMLMDIYEQAIAHRKYVT